MAEQGGFSVGKLAGYSLDEIQTHLRTFEQRASSLSQLSGAYNDKTRDALNGPGTPQEQLNKSYYWSNLRDVAKEMATEAQKKAAACQIELHLRQQ